MIRYQLDYEAKARKQLRAVRDVRLKAALKEALDGLITDPRPHGCLKMSGLKRTKKTTFLRFRSTLLTL